MARTVNIVVTCTSRKRQPSSPSLRLRSVREQDIEKRARKWIERLRVARPIRPACDLYSGEYWSIARSLPDVAREFGITARMWICSAGYGLISFESQICSYSATFSPYDVDSVTRGIEADLRATAAQCWWRAIGDWRGPAGNGVRSISGIAKHYPKVPLLVVASPDYLQALEEDVHDAEGALADSDLLLIASAGMRKFGRLTKYLLPCDARLQSCLGGTRASLNIRIAKRVLGYMKEGAIGLERQKLQLRRLLSKQSPIAEYARRPLTDDQVKGFIHAELKRRPGGSRTALLRRLRDSGRACEQSRFGKLYREMVSNEKIA